MSVQKLQEDKGDTVSPSTQLLGMATPGSSVNPLIGLKPADTMNNCEQVLRVLQSGTTDDEAMNSDDDRMGWYLALQCVRYALIWEAENHRQR